MHQVLQYRPTTLLSSTTIGPDFKPTLQLQDMAASTIGASCDYLSWRVQKKISSQRRAQAGFALLHLFGIAIGILFL